MEEAGIKLTLGHALQGFVNDWLSFPMGLPQYSVTRTPYCHRYCVSAGHMAVHILQFLLLF